MLAIVIWKALPLLSAAGIWLKSTIVLAIICFALFWCFFSFADSGKEGEHDSKRL